MHVWYTILYRPSSGGSREMAKTHDKPLTPLELFQRGIEITQEIRGRIEEARAYYLGRSSREPAQPLSEVFDPMRGPILKYFVQTVRTITRTPFIERFCQSAAFREFRQESEATLEELRLLAIQLGMCLGVPDKTDRRRSVGQALKTSVYFFRIANGRFFRQLPWNGSLVHLLLKNHSNEGFGIYIADRLLNDIAKAFEVRERQLRGESAAVEHEFFTNQFEKIERKIESEHERGQVPRKRHTRQGASDGCADGDETGRIRPQHQNHPRPFSSRQPTAAKVIHRNQQCGRAPSHHLQPELRLAKVRRDVHYPGNIKDSARRRS